jgi:Domain of unknown function (DUF4159)
MKRLLVASCILALAAAAVGAQGFRQGWGRIRTAPPRFPDANSFDGSYTFCRGMYTSDRREAGGMGWWTDYPDADINFSIRLSELTKVHVSKQPDGEPNHLVVHLTDDALFNCPMIQMEDVGTMRLSDMEVERLREYLMKGGFLYVDDFWGEWAWDQWAEEIGRVLPPNEYPIKDITPDHQLFRQMFVIDKLPQIPSINSWMRLGGATSERGAETAVPDIRGISDKNGRLMVVMTHDTDISDAWEREGEDPRYFYQFSPDGYAVGINVVIYALTH